MLSTIAGITRALAFSTTTPLAANAVYTSPTVDAINYKVPALRAFSDVAGGLIFQFSDDGVVWDSSTNSAITANTMSSLGPVIVGRYMRVVFTNGASPQTTFRLSLYLSPL